MPAVIPSGLAALWERCTPSDAGMPAPDFRAIFEQSHALRLGIAFRHRGDGRPEGYARVLHSQAVVALVDWTARALAGETIGGLLGSSRVALARFSNVPEPQAFVPDCQRTPENDYLLGVALKFFEEGSPESAGNILFATTANGLASPGFFRPESAFSTQPGPVICGEARRALQQQFRDARDQLEQAGFEHSRKIDMLELSDLVRTSPPPVRLDLVPLLDIALPAGSEFQRALITHPKLSEGASLYDVRASFEDGGSFIVASISLRTRFRISERADRELFFAHPCLPGATLDAGDRLPVELRPPPDRANLETRIGSPEISLTERRRYEALLLVATQHSVDLAARLTGLSRADVREIIALYENHGIDGVVPRPLHSILADIASVHKSDLDLPEVLQRMNALIVGVNLFDVEIAALEDEARLERSRLAMK